LIGIVNYYRDLWFCINELLARLHLLASHQVESSLNGAHPINRPLIKLRKSLEMRADVLLCYPDFNDPSWFHIYTDECDKLIIIFLINTLWYVICPQDQT
jgi:hypothetical protein